MTQQLQRQMTIGFLAALALMVALAVISYLSTRRLAMFADETTRDQAALTQLNGLMSAMTDVETGSRGFIVTGDETYLEPYRSAQSRVDGELDLLNRLTHDEPQLQQRLDALRPLVTARIAIAETLVTLRRGRGFEAARQRMIMGEGEREHDLIRAVVADMSRLKTQGLQEREDRMHRSARWSLAIVALGGLLAVVLISEALVLVRRGFAERLHAEELLRQSNASLLLATEQAQAADRLKSAFLATMSHELRTPLNSIIGFTGIMLQELPGPLNPEQVKQLGMVQGSARHLLALINDVLDISKIEAGEMTVSREPFDVRDSITRLVGMVTPLAGQKGLALHVRLAPEPGQAIGDPRRTEQVLLNLLNNAIKFSERGAVTLTVDLTPDQVRFAVVDTGIGIKPDDLSTLFQPFRQVDSGLARAHEGTGLGLAICRRLAELMGGDVRAESTWGQGSVFTFALPRHHAVPS